MSKNFTILATSDVHGYVYPYSYADNKEANLGLARIDTIVKKLKDENTILIDNGDCLQGSPLCFYFNNNNNNQTHIMTKVLNKMGYDYLNLGNHDFNLGTKVLLRHIEQSNAPCITVNVKVNGKPVGHYVVHEFKNGVKIGLFGVVTQHLVNWEQPENLVGVELDNAYEKAKEMVEYISKNEKVDAIVCAYHGGFEKDIETGKATELLNGENRGYDMCQDIDGLDILVSGHQHRSIAGHCANVLTSQSASNAKEIAKLDYDTLTKTGFAKLIPADEEPDEEILKLLEDVNNDCQKWLDTPLGHSELDLLVHDQFDARLHKHPVVSFLNQVQKSLYPKADFSATALFNDAAGFKHDVSMRDVVSTYVYSNTAVAMKMRGHVLKEYLELCAEYFEMENGEIIVSPRFAAPKPSHFNYDMVDGLDYTIKVSNPIGERIISMTRNGKDLDLDSEYIMLVSNYRAGGGGDFNMLTKATVEVEIQKDMVEAIGEYILLNPEIKVEHKENVKVIK